MHKFRVFRESNLNIAWLIIEEGNINIETGIRFVYTFLDYNLNIVDKNVFIINGNDFADLGMSGKDTRIAILELLCMTTNVILVKE
jgi:hypothetical protein